MAKLKLLSTIFSKLSTLGKNDGQVIVSKDSKSLYVDLDGERIEVTDWIDVDTEENLLAILTPLINKYYYTKDSNKIWRYVNGEWICLNNNINDQSPTYAESTSLVKLSSGEKLSIAFGKISKAITDLISHIGDSVKHITSTERTNWNNAKLHADSAHARTDATKVEKSSTNGNIKINGTETTVYTHPSGTNPHGTTKSDVGLGNVDNTKDIDKPISTKQQEKFDELNSNLVDLKVGENGCGKNHFNKNNVSSGYLNGSGYIIDNAMFSTSDYIYVEGVSAITISGNSGSSEIICFFDTNKNIINSISVGQSTIKPITVPNNATFVRCTVKNTNLDVYQLEFGNIATEYEPYIPSVKIIAEEVSTQNESLVGLENDCLTLQNTPLKNGVYLGDTGDFLDHNAFKCSSEYHEITPNTPIKLELNTDNDDWGLLFYDENKTYLGRSNSVLVLSGKSIETTTPPNAKYATFNIHLYNGNYPIPKLYTTKIGKVVSNLNESLDEQGLLNKFDGQYKQGAYSTADGTWKDIGFAISNTNKIYCKSGDIIDLKYSSSIRYLFIEFFNGNDEFISSKVADNASVLRETAPENTSYIRFGIQVENGALTPDTAGKTIVYVNNAIDEIKNDLVAHTHSNHVPATQTANNAVFLRNDNTWQTVTPANIGAAASSHTHSYAGSSSAGGSATSAVKLDSSAGSATQPVYFSGGKPVACTYTLGKSVPSNAVFTDTWRGIQNNLTSTSTTDSLSANQGKILNETKVGFVKVAASEIAKTNNNPFFGNVENEDIGIGNGKYYSVINIGSYSGGNFRSQIAMPYQDSITESDMYIRTDKNGTWRPWRKIIHSGNIGSQSVSYATSAGNADTLDGNHASAFITTGNANPQVISVSNSDTAISLKSNSSSSWIGFINSSGVSLGYFGVNSSNEACFHTSNNGTKKIITTGNIGSQSVNYANTAGSAPANGGTSTYANNVWTQSHNGSWYINSNWNGTYFVTNAKHTGGDTLPIYVDNSGRADTLSGFTNTTTSATAVDNATQNGHVYVNGTSGIGYFSDGACYVQAYSASWVHQIYGDYRTGQIAVRGKNNGTWQSWRKVLDSSNYTSYTVTKTGSGASGTWGINVTGSSASCTGNSATATALTTSAGSATQPVYFSGGKPVACTYTLGKSVPSDAVFTDTHYTSHLYVGTSGGTANATSATSNPYLLCVDNTTNRNSIQLKAGSNMSISAVNGVITFSATDTNTTYTLGSFGLTATATELNYCDGVTSNIQTQLNSKASSSTLTNFIYAQRYESGTGSCSGNSTRTYTISFTVPTGYTFLTYIVRTMSNSYMFCYNSSIESSSSSYSITVNVRNTSSSSQSGSVACVVLFMKSV